MSKKKKPVECVDSMYSQKSSQKVSEDNENNRQLLYSNIKKKLKITYKNQHQIDFCKLMDDKEIVLVSGPAGTGKTFLAVMKALQLLVDEDTPYHKIYISKPAIESDENIGFLPGDIENKMMPFIYSIYYFIEKIIGKRRAEKLKKDNIIEILPLGFIRGMNIDNSILIVDEIQNIKETQVKTILTRIGDKSKFFLTGDLQQSDLFKDSKKTGLYIAMNKLTDIDEIGIFSFDDSDIVRNPIIKKILDKLN